MPSPTHGVLPRWGGWSAMETDGAAWVWMAISPGGQETGRARSEEEAIRAARAAWGRQRAAAALGEGPCATCGGEPGSPCADCGRDAEPSGDVVRQGGAAMVAEFESHPNAQPASRELELALHREEHFELEVELLGRSDLLGHIDRKRLARELADVTYLAYRSAHVHGIDLDEALRLIHEAAMVKMEANVRRDAGKLVKPPGFAPPCMESALRTERP